MTITSLETISAFDIVTGNFMFTLDELQSASINQSQEQTEITGKGGRKLANLKKNKSPASGPLLKAGAKGAAAPMQNDILVCCPRLSGGSFFTPAGFLEW